MGFPRGFRKYCKALFSHDSGLNFPTIEMGSWRHSCTHLMGRRQDDEEEKAFFNIYGILMTPWQTAFLIHLIDEKANRLETFWHSQWWKERNTFRGGRRSRWKTLLIAWELLKFGAIGWLMSRRITASSWPGLWRLSRLDEANQHKSKVLDSINNQKANERKKIFHSYDWN